MVRDLLAIDIDATKFLPSDDSTHGFDNMAGTLTLSPALLEAYISAAGKISRLAMEYLRADADCVNVPVDTTQNYHVEGLPFGTRGGTVIHHVFPVDGEYAIRIYSVKKGNMGGSGTFGGVRARSWMSVSTASESVLWTGIAVSRHPPERESRGTSVREYSPRRPGLTRSV